MKHPFLSFFLLGFLAFGAWQVLEVGDAFAAHGKESKGEKSEKGEGKKSKENDITGGRFEGDPIYVRIAPLILPIISDNGVEQLVSLLITVHVKDLEAANTLHRNMPRATDSLLRHLYGELDDSSVRKGKMVSLPKIKSKAIAAISEIISREKVEDVLIEGISQRML